jgi:hypothetical protein
VSPTLAEVRTNIFYLTGTYYVTPAVVVDGGVYRTIDKDQDTRATITALRKKRTIVFAVCNVFILQAQCSRGPREY